VRAAVFIGVVSLAAYSGRRAMAANAIAASALVVLALNPADLFRVGPQLSFLAVGTLAWCGSLRWFRRGAEVDPLDRLIRESRPLPMRAARNAGWWFGRLFVAGAAIWLVALPLIMARFHLATPVALVLGPLLWLPVAFCLLCGFGTLLLGWLVPGAGTLFGAGCNAGLGLLERAVQISHDLPYSHFWVPGPTEWWLTAFYAALLLLVMAPRLRPPRRWCVGLLAGWMAVGFLPPLIRQAESDRFACTFLAMGHGSATVLELPGGQTMLYDAGRLGSPQGGARSVAAYLWSRGITRLDALVISHADADHYNAVPELLVRFPVRVAYVSPMMFEEPLPLALVTLRDSLSAAGTEIREIWAGDRLATGSDVDIQVMHPPRRGVLGSDNANSLVLAVEYRGHRMLLPGDLESPGLEDVIAEAPYDCHILMAPHHGSRRSDPPGFAAWSSPEYVVVSGGFRDDVAPVAATYRQVAASRVLHTAASGAIRFELVGEKLKITTWRTNY
jgi:competence protein ComEC